MIAEPSNTLTTFNGLEWWRHIALHEQLVLTTNAVFLRPGGNLHFTVWELVTAVASFFSFWANWSGSPVRTVLGWRINTVRCYWRTGFEAMLTSFSISVDHFRWDVSSPSFAPPTCAPSRVALKSGLRRTLSGSRLA